MQHLDVYVFSEAATDRLIDEVLAPAVAQYLPGHDIEPLRRVFGVDGEYGRHYSFLKAIAADDGTLKGKNMGVYQGQNSLT